MKRIENLLRSSIGLHAATIGTSVVEHTIRSRMARLGLTSHDAYIEVLRNSPAEWNNLIETMVVTETWFFREKHPFSALVRLVLDEWLPAHPDQTLRLLSVPCASGEEPYSMAMALLDAGVPAGRFQIDAIDISARALAFAQRGVFGKNSFRGADLEFRNRHFVSTRGSFLLNPAVRRMVRFQRGNILSPDCLAETGVYDYIFCRNLLIYFDRPTQDETLVKLRHLLVMGGALFTASAELPVALENGFASLDLPRSFACRKTKKKAPAATSLHPVEAPVETPGSVAVVPDSPKPRAARSAPPAGNLVRARELADEGHLAEAAEICHAHLRENGVSAEAFYILGLVQDTTGEDAQAGEFYRKALYLEPDHLDAMQRWALLSERNGQRDHARRLRQRAERRQPDQAQPWML